MPDYDKINRLWQRTHFTEVYYVTINGQITGKLDPLARTKKGNYPPPFCNLLHHSNACFLPKFKCLVQWSNLQVQWGPVSPLCAGVSLCHWMTQTGARSRDSFPVRGEVGRSLQGSGNYYLKYFSIITWHPGCECQCHACVTCLDYWICHVTRVTHGPRPLPWLPSLRWHWCLIWSQAHHSYLNFAANYPAAA